ncbi:Rhamnogalacturonyl hydrolase YesR [Parapedobacter composti]|uniref:Rhamnogalacturonyl hydrolase YesR n=1 Tax=Parapedobacter composti TaxID=623281 RepID=A0A1I1E389_9SPHI|nr:Rhamnogalacturonyl hydrolase YesR [Parapedobacter composti]
MLFCRLVKRDVLKKFSVLLILLGSGWKCIAQDEDLVVVRRVADYLLSQAAFGFVDEGGRVYAKASDIPEGIEAAFQTSYGAWHYTNGVINMAMLQLADFTGDQKYAQYALDHVAFGFDNYRHFQRIFKNDRPHHRFPFGQLWTMQELDDFGAMSASILEVYKHAPREEYKTYLENGIKRLTYGQDRLADGTLVRTFPVDKTLWADDLYMSVPFLARMAAFTGNERYWDDAVNQVLNFDKYLWHDGKELYYHCYYSPYKRNGVAHWGRSNGWIVLAQLHLLDRLPAQHPHRDDIIENLQKQLVGLSRYQDAEGLWHQLLDKPDSYAEASASAMFIQGFAKAVNEGWLDENYASVALVGWEGFKKHFITEDGQVKDICIGTGIADDLRFYYTRPARANEKHGVGSVIDAGIEIVKLKQKLKKDQ